jgi:hypothetical protein
MRSGFLLLVCLEEQEYDDAQSNCMFSKALHFAAVCMLYSRHGFHRMDSVICDRGSPFGCLSNLPDFDAEPSTAHSQFMQLFE